MPAKTKAEFDAMTFDQVIADIEGSLADGTGLGIALTRKMARTLLDGIRTLRPEVGRNVWTWCKDGMPGDGTECLVWHVLGDSSRSPHAIDIATWVNGKWIFPWDRGKLNSPPQWVRAWRPQIAPPTESEYVQSPLGRNQEKP